MGSFASLLGGLAQGTSSAYAEIDKANRELKAKQNDSMAEAIHARLTSPDAGDTPDIQDHLFEQYLRLKGVNDKKVIEGMKYAAGYHRKALADYEKQQRPTSPLPTSPDQTSAATPADEQGVSLPGIPLPPTQGIPALPAPPYQAKTVAQLNFEEARPRTQQAEADKNNAQREAQRTALTGEIEDKVALLKKIEGDNTIPESDKQYYRQILRANPTGTGAGGKPVNLPGTMSGEAVIAKLNQQGEDSSHIDPKSSYRVTLNAARDKLLSAFETERQTLQGKAGLGSKYIGVFPTDQLGNPTDENGLYFPILARNGGKVIGILPEAALGTQTVKKGYQPVQMQDGTTAFVAVTTVTETQKTAGGVPLQTPGSAQVAPPVPTAGAPGAPGTPEVRPTPGQPVPRTATPSTPLPKQASAGISRTPVEIPGAGKPMSPEQKVKSAQQAELYNTTIGNVNSLLRDLPVLNSMVSTGKVILQTDPEQGFLHWIANRAMPLTPTETRIAQHWQQLSEEIYESRIAMGAAASRSKEMMAKIDANKGNLTQNVNIIRGMLQNTLAEFKNLRDPLTDAGKKYGFTVEPELSHSRDEDMGEAKKNPFR